jgi:hypothetical protein
MIKALLEFFDYLLNTPYEVIIRNSVDEDVINLTVFYHRNVYVPGTGTVPTGPFSKSLQALPPTEAADFYLCPCLYMATKYDIAFEYQGKQQYMNMSLDVLNAEEKAIYGDVAFCSDEVEIAFL